MTPPVPPVVPPPVVAVPVSTSGPMSPAARYIIAFACFAFSGWMGYGMVQDKDTITWAGVTLMLVPLVLGVGAAVPATLSFVVTLAKPFVPQVKFGRKDGDS